MTTGGFLRPALEERIGGGRRVTAPPRRQSRPFLSFPREGERGVSEKVTPEDPFLSKFLKPSSAQIKKQLHTPKGIPVLTWNSLTPQQHKDILGETEAVRPAAEFVGGQKIAGERLEAYTTRERDKRAIKSYWITPLTGARIPIFEEPRGLERIIQPYYTPSPETGLAPADILGFVGFVATIVLSAGQGVQAIRSLTEFRRLPQYKAMVDVAKDRGIPRNSKVFKDAENVLRTSVNLYRRGAKEAGNEIMARFNAAYARAYPTARPVTPPPRPVPPTGIVPRATQSLAMLQGSLPKEVPPVPPVVPPVAPVGEVKGELRADFEALLKPKVLSKEEKAIAKLEDTIDALDGRISKAEDAGRDTKALEAQRDVAERKIAELEEGIQPKPTPKPEAAVTPPVTEPGQPEAGLQPSMFGEVAAKEVRPVGRGRVTQISMEDQLKLQQAREAVAPAEVLPEAARTVPEVTTQRIEEISRLLETKGRLPKVEGTKPQLKLELARLEAESDVARFSNEELQRALEEVETELGNRDLPFHGRATGNLFPEKNVQQLDEIWEVYKKALQPVALARVETIQSQGSVAPESVTSPDAKYAHTELTAPNGPKPPGPPRPPTARAKPSQNPDDIIKEIADKTPLGERPDQALLRLHEAARNNISRRSNIIIEKGNQKLKAQGIGQVKRGFLVPREQDFPKLDALYNALHNPSKVESGEIAVPEGFEEIYSELRGLALWDTASRLDFDPTAATLEDWFFRGWKPPEGLPGGVPGRGQLVTEPKALRTPRVDASYQEMRDLGFEPLFWNPYQQWGYRHNLGEVYREQMQLVDYLKALGSDLVRPDAGGALPPGWRVPKIGPAFEGKPFAATDTDGIPAVMFTRRWIVPDKVANSLENIYGRRPDMGKLIVAGKAVDPVSIIDAITFIPKRAKLFLSFFQQMDFLNRAGGGTWAGAIDNILAGKPLAAAVSIARYPQTVFEIIQANLSPGKRLSLSEQFDDTIPLVQGRPGVNLKGISEAGLSTMDLTIFAEDMDKMMRSVAENYGAWEKAKGLGSAVVDLESAMRRGLFQGTYPAAMITDIKNNMAVMMARQHPTATDEQLNAMIAKAVNTRYSTIPPSQSVIQNTFLRETLRRLFFSMGETEGLLRQATGMFRGPNKAFWAKQNLGIALFVLAVANIIHFLSTGEPLPKERYVPITKDNWGPLPFGYNTKFASPTIPFEGRGGAELTLDLMGQMDTAFRVLNPGSFVNSRTSVPVRAMINQVSGTDFFGAPIDMVGPGGVVSRTAQLGLDLFSPIGVGGITTEALRQVIPGAEDIIPEGESRLGLAGLGLQASGANIRAEQTGQLLDRAASLSGFIKRDGSEVKKWADLEPHQKKQLMENQVLVDELNLRGEISAERDIPGAKGFEERKELDRQRIARGESLVSELNSGELEAKPFRDEVTRLKTEIASRKSQVDEDFQLFQDTQELPEDPNKRALVEYFSIFDKAKRESGSIDWDVVEQWEDAYRVYWTDEQEAFVDDNIGITSWGPLMQEYVDAQEVLKESGYWDIDEPNKFDKQRTLRIQNTEVEAILTSKYYDYKPIWTQLPQLRTPTAGTRPSMLESLRGGSQRQPVTSGSRPSMLERLRGR